PLEPFTPFTRELDARDIAYMVTGSAASLLHGEPRITHDIDLVVEIRGRDIAALEDAFPEQAYYLPPTDVPRIESRRAHHGHFNVIHHETGFKADVYVKTTSPLHTWGFARRRRIEAGAHALWVAPP